MPVAQRVSSQHETCDIDDYDAVPERFPILLVCPKITSGPTKVVECPQDSKRRTAVLRVLSSQKGRANMGRGRQKAKDAKIARQLKYTDHSSDLRELERELIGHSSVPAQQSEDDGHDRWSDDDD